MKKHMKHETGNWNEAKTSIEPGKFFHALGWIQWFVLIQMFVSPQTSVGQHSSIGQQTLDLHDTGRNRPVKTEVWYPTTETDGARERETPLPFVLKPTIRNATLPQGRFPLAVLSHGTGGNRFGLAWLAIALAERGYIVAAPDHWGNTYDNKIPEYFVRYWERPLDIRFVIDKLLENENFGTLVAENRVGMAGFSLGGFTSLAMAGAGTDCQLLQRNAQDKKHKNEVNVPELGDLRKLIAALDCSASPTILKDDRVKAAVAIAPALGLAFNSRSQMQNADVPVLIIGMESDEITPVATNAKHYHSLLPNAEYLEIPGKAGHYVMLNEAKAELKKEAKRYYRDEPSVNRQEVHRLVIKWVIDFFQKSM